MIRRTLLFVFIVVHTNWATAQPTAPANSARLFSLQSLHDQCIEFSEVKVGKDDIDVGDCRVSAFGSFGSIGPRTYYYALYCLIPNDRMQHGRCDSESFHARYHETRALAIFVEEEASGQATLLIERASLDIGLFVYEQPEIIENAFGTLLFVPIRLDGTGVGNVSEYYLWHQDKAEWRRLDAETWLQDLRKRIPPGLHIWKGIWPNLQRMTAEAGLYQDGDAQASPTGGTARIELHIDNGRFAVKSVTLSK
ncbi:MAG: hypothetical protein HYZ81_19010 [Nitrospinae bacterium]|nr:hypothetical protein [Nitrospinota bacterium]